MYKYVLKRLLMLIPVIIGVSFLVFFIMSLSPGDPARTILGETAPIEAVEALREELGLNDPVLKRYVDYMGGLLHGDMGTSYKSNRPVFDEIMGRFPATLKLSLWGMLFAVALLHPHRHHIRHQTIFVGRRGEYGGSPAGRGHPQLLAGLDPDHRLLP